MAVIFFIVFVMDLGEEATNEIKYADDITLWVTHLDIQQAVLSLEKDLLLVDHWCTRWRQSCSQSKTEVIAFTEKGEINVSVKMQGSILKQVLQRPSVVDAVISNRRIVRLIFSTPFKETRESF